MWIRPVSRPRTRSTRARPASNQAPFGSRSASARVAAADPVRAACRIARGELDVRERRLVRHVEPGRRSPAPAATTAGRRATSPSIRWACPSNRATRGRAAWLNRANRRSPVIAWRAWRRLVRSSGAAAQRPIRTSAAPSMPSIVWNEGGGNRSTSGATPSAWRQRGVVVARPLECLRDEPADEELVGVVDGRPEQPVELGDQPRGRAGPARGRRRGPPTGSTGDSGAAPRARVRRPPRERSRPARSNCAPVQPGVADVRVAGMPAHPIADLAEDRHAPLGDPVGRRPVGDDEVVDALELRRVARGVGIADPGARRVGQPAIVSGDPVELDQAEQEPHRGEGDDALLGIAGGLGVVQGGEHRVDHPDQVVPPVRHLGEVAMALGDRQRPISLVGRDPAVVDTPPALEPEVPPDRQRPPDPTARVGRPEELETRLEMGQRLAIPGGLDQGDAGPALPVRAGRRGRRPAGRVVEGEGLREERERLGVGVVLECLTARSAQVVDGLVGHARPGSSDGRGAGRAARRPSRAPRTTRRRPGGADGAGRR